MVHACRYTLRRPFLRTAERVLIRHGSVLRPGRDPAVRRRRTTAASVTSRAPRSRPVPDVDGRSFVVQRHRARRLHYDLRLQIDGVLFSWAVPKGPTLDPMVRGAAFHVADHPLDYFDFEGIIPVGGYGGGDVIVWDAGTWRPGDGEDPRRAVETGELHFDLEGQKLRGRFVLVRTRTDARTDGSLGKPRESGKEQWLLLHKNDEFAVHGWIPRTTRARCSADASTTRSRQTRTGSGDPIFPRRARRSCCVRPPSRARPTTNWTHWTRSAGPVPGRFSGALNMHRYPNGALAKGFWQKELPRHAPVWLPRWNNRTPIPTRRGPTWWWMSRLHWSGPPTSARSSGTHGHPRWTARIGPATC